MQQYLATGLISHSAPTAADRPALASLLPTAIQAYWVGHGQFDAQAHSISGEMSVAEMVGWLARKQGLSYRMDGQVARDAGLSLQWRGRAHVGAGEAAELALKRQVFQALAANYNALVTTETAPLDSALNHEFSAFYLRKFADALAVANPAGRIFLFEAWLRPTSATASNVVHWSCRSDWRARMIAQRKLWDRLADEAAGGHLQSPARRGWFSRVFSFNSKPISLPARLIYTIPVGSALVAVADRLRRPGADDDFEKPDGELLTFEDLFAQARADAAARRLSINGAAARTGHSRSMGRPVRLSAAPRDGGASSVFGVYLAALTSYSVIYRRSPLGLASPPEVGARLGRTLQRVVWDVVSREPRTGLGAIPTRIAQQGLSADWPRTDRAQAQMFASNSINLDHRALNRNRNADSNCAGSDLRHDDRC